MAAVLDQSQSNGTGNLAFGDGSVKGVAQQFTPGVSADIAKVTVRIRNQYFSVDTVELKIYSSSADSPNTVLATSTTVFDGAAHPWTDGYIDTDFLFSSGTSLVSGTPYFWVALRTGAQDPTLGNTYALRYSNADLYSGSTRYLNSSDTWADFGDTNDMYFLEYYESANVSSKPSSLLLRSVG